MGVERLLPFGQLRRMGRNGLSHRLFRDFPVQILQHFDDSDRFHAVGGPAVLPLQLCHLVDHSRIYHFLRSEGNPPAQEVALYFQLHDRAFGDNRPGGMGMEPFGGGERGFEMDQKHLFDPVGVGRGDFGHSVRIDGAEYRMGGREVAEELFCATERFGRIVGDGGEPLDHALEIEAAPPHEDQIPAVFPTVFGGAPVFVDKGHDACGGVGGETVDSEMERTGELLFGGFGRCDVDLRVDAERIDGEDGGVAALGEGQCQIAFARSGRADKRELFHAYHYTRWERRADERRCATPREFTIK